MLSKASEDRYHVVIDYAPTIVHLSLVRGMHTEYTKEVVVPTWIERMLGATLEKRINTVRSQIQAECDQHNEQLDMMKLVCTEAEKMVD